MLALFLNCSFLRVFFLNEHSCSHVIISFLNKIEKERIFLLYNLHIFCIVFSSFPFCLYNEFCCCSEVSQDSLLGSVNWKHGPWAHSSKPPAMPHASKTHSDFFPFTGASLLATFFKFLFFFLSSLSSYA